LDCDHRRGLIEKDHPKMTVKRQCEFLGVPRATHYYRPRPASAQNLALMRAIDELHLAYPQFGSRNFVYWLNREGWRINRKRVQRLMRKMGLEALVLKRRGLSKPHPDHPVYPYLLKGTAVTRPNQVWSADITYVPIRGGCAYLVAILDWYSRKVLAWELSNTLDAGFCARARRRALSQYGNPEIFNTDQGSQFTSAEWLGVFKDRPIRISMDGRGRAIDNIYIERLWRTVKYDEIYLKDYVSLIDAHTQLDTFFRFYNDLRPHRAHNGATPAEVYNAPTSVVLDA
jgi:putative transposase